MMGVEPIVGNFEGSADEGLDVGADGEGESIDEEGMLCVITGSSGTRSGASLASRCNGSKSFSSSMAVDEED